MEKEQKNSYTYIIIIIQNKGFFHWNKRQIKHAISFFLRGEVLKSSNHQLHLYYFLFMLSLLKCIKSEASQKRGESIRIGIECFGKQSLIQEEHYWSDLFCPVCKEKIGTYLEKPCHAPKEVTKIETAQWHGVHLFTMASDGTRSSGCKLPGTLGQKLHSSSVSK